MKPLSILYLDDHLVAIDKPSGVLTHPSRIASDHEPSAMELLRDQIGTWVYPLHRLDRATSGVLLFALDQETARCAQENFTNGHMQKRYLAVTRGYAPDEVEVERALKERLDRITDHQATPNKPPQSAHTSFSTWARCSLALSTGRYPTTRLSLVEARPHTGRRHQIRRHLAGLSYPLVGDTSHGRGELNRLFREQFQCHRLLLAAIEMSLIHPLSKEQLTISAQLTGEMKRVCVQLFLEDQQVNQFINDENQKEISRDNLSWLRNPQSLRQYLASS